MAEALSQREFDTWRESDNEFKQEMRELLRGHAALHLATEGRLATLEANHEKTKTVTTNRTTWISALVASIVGGLCGWLAK
jgi:ferric-dicitrate binding protein FerR (iron transport regulator)